MSLPAFQRFQKPDDRELMLLQDNAGRVLDALKSGSPIKDTQTDPGNGNITGFAVAPGSFSPIDGVLFRSVPFATSKDVVLPHGLGRRAEYLVVSINSALTILRSPNDAVSASRSAQDQKGNIILVTNGPCVADIWCC